MKNPYRNYCQGINSEIEKWFKARYECIDANYPKGTVINDGQDRLVTKLVEISAEFKVENMRAREILASLQDQIGQKLLDSGLGKEVFVNCYPVVFFDVAETEGGLLKLNGWMEVFAKVM